MHIPCFVRLHSFDGSDVASVNAIEIDILILKQLQHAIT